MSAIKVIVFIPRAAERWLKLESLQIDKLQFLIIGKVSLIDKSSKDIQKSLYPDFKISFNISCSSLFLPVAKKNLHFLFSYIILITPINIFAGILFLGPDPPIPKRILNSSLLI